MSDYSSVLIEVDSALRERVIGDSRCKVFREKTTNLEVLGLRLPIIQEVDRAGFDFYNGSPGEVLAVWDQVWENSNVHEVMYLPLFYYRRHKKSLDEIHWEVMKRWIEYVENWEHADALCSLYSYFYEKFPKLVEPTLFQWNTSSNPWKQRASIVSTVYYASKNRVPPSISTVFRLITPLLSHADAYVQKAVGWQLREVYKLDQKKGLAFIKKHLLDLAPVSYSYATEKLPKNLKKRFNLVRKEARALAK